ncbi:MAG: DUF1700 domain-containing protein [Clostridiaceae bacterium]|nr:DUF1700 domain-containing protein [Clostridiaceae bacterium]
MREQYIKQVKKELAVSRKLKYEILRDLNEAFDSAAEHGETEGQVIDRLGTPKDFVGDFEETAGFNRAQYRKRRQKLIWICCLCGIAIFCFIAGLIASNSVLPDNVIGQADAMTLITVNGYLPFDISTPLLLIGFVFTVVAAILIISLFRKKKQTLEETK